ncbi:phage tail tape measure protein [Mesorhizobium sp. CAU 1741]|uniref:phage tail tape measure protein n=1 Tax=Mesorhizobium sp. CAU 1741 TaxID=3140366 RepID=UPI00325ABBC1
MTDDPTRLEVRIDADTRPFADAMADLTRLSDSFGRQLSGAMREAVVGGKSLEDVLRRVGMNLAGMALSQGLQPLTGLFSRFSAGLFGGIGNVLPFAKGGVTGPITPFASGGVIAAPTYFPMSGGATGLMGEAGAEAILPLRRGSDGRLGVAGAGGGSGVNVVFNVSTQDAASFRKSEAQITGMLARAVSRGSRTI